MEWETCFWPIDIGNSNITLGGIQEGEILFEAHLAH